MDSFKMNTSNSEINDFKNEVAELSAEVARLREGIYPLERQSVPTPQFPSQQYMSICGCPFGTVCANSACPHRPIIT